MKKFSKKLLALICAMVMIGGCCVGCGSKETTDTPSTSNTKEVATKVESKDKGDLIMESSIIKVYAKGSVITFDCNNDEGIDDLSVNICDKEDMSTLFEHDAYVEEPSKDLTYSYEIEKDGEYQMNMEPYSKDTESDDSYSIDFVVKDNKVDVSQFVYDEELTGSLPTLAIHGTNLNDVDLAENDDMEEETTEDNTHTLTFKVDGKELPMQLSYDEIKDIFNDCEFDESHKDSDSIIDVNKNGKTILKLMDVNDTSCGFYNIEDAQSSDFTIEIEGFTTITKDMTKDELLTSYDGYIEDAGNIVMIEGNLLSFESNIMGISIYFDENGNITRISL